jgi:WD40-like Beta Propeller Repeat
MGRALVAVVLVGCRFTPGVLTDDAAAADDARPDIAIAEDAAVTEIDATPDALVLGAWGTPVMRISTGSPDDPTMTDDLLELYFNSNSDIWRATRATPTAAFDTPAQVPSLSSGANETTPEITGDGLTIFIASSRTGTAGNDDIWVATRANTATSTWGTPARIPELSTASGEAASAPTDDLLAIVIISTRAGGLGNADIYLSTRATTSVAWGTPTNVMAPVNTSGDDYSPMLSQDRLSLYFDSARSGNSDLFVATRATTSDSFGTPVPLTELNTSGAETDPWVSADQRHIFFVRDGALYEASR